MPQALDYHRLVGDWEPLGIRMGWRVDEAPYEGIPDHLKATLETWCMSNLGVDARSPQNREMRQRTCSLIASKLRLDLSDASHLVGNLIAIGDYDPHRLFEIIDMHLKMTRGYGATDLDTLLAVGGSVWTLDGEHRGLERRVDPSEKEAYLRTVSPSDDASEHLRSAWAEAFGVTPNPSRAWSDAIKAVEALLWGLVIPKNDKATLGSIISAVDAAPKKWAFRLSPSGSVGGVAAFTQTLRFIWPNPDRHGSGTVRVPDQHEAEDVVRTAVLVVGWLRNGALTLAP